MPAVKDAAGYLEVEEGLPRRNLAQRGNQRLWERG